MLKTAGSLQNQKTFGTQSSKMFTNILLGPTKTLFERIKPSHLPPRTYLGGGTAVAFYLGHRRSQDLDFFTPHEFVETQWERKLEKELGFRAVQRDWQTLIGTIGTTKISLFGYKYKLIGKLEELYNIPVASLPDLACMKLETVIGRGTKRDFIDIYFLAQKYRLAKLFKFYQKKYGNLKERELMLKKGLIFFADAEADEMPDMEIPVDWKEVKRYLLAEVRHLGFVRY